MRLGHYEHSLIAHTAVFQYYHRSVVASSSQPSETRAMYQPRAKSNPLRHRRVRMTAFQTENLVQCMAAVGRPIRTIVALMLR
jgi:hypothetical protein